MLKNSLLNIPQIVLLRSDKVFDKLVSTILNDNIKSVSSNNFDEVFEGVRDFYPNTYRLDEMELSLSTDEIKNSGIEKDYDFKRFNGIDYNFSFLDKIFDDFFRISGSNIYAKEETLEEYLGFITKVSPMQILGYKLAHFLENKTIELTDLKSLVSGYTPLGLEVNKLDKYAENHLHLKGASYVSYNMFKLFSSGTSPNYFKKKFLKKIPRINEFSFINNHTYSIGQIIEILKLSIDFIYGSFMDDEIKHIDIYQEYLHKILITNKATKINYKYSVENISKMNKLFPIFKNTVEDSITQEIMKCYEKDDYPQSYLLENTLFFYIFSKTKSEEVKIFIKLYFQASNILRSYMVMSQNQGLAHFSEFSGSYLRNAERKNANSIASSIVNSGTHLLNAKMDVKENSKDILSMVETFKNAFDSKNTNLEYNFGLSSSKSREKDIKIQTTSLLPRFHIKRR